MERCTRTNAHRVPLRGFGSSRRGGMQAAWRLLHSAPLAGVYSRLRREEALGSHVRIPNLLIRQKPRDERHSL